MPDDDFEQSAESEISPDQLRAMQVEAIFAQPLALPVRWGTRPVQLEDGPAIVLELQTPVSSQRVVLPREDALRLVSDIRKAARTGPSLVVPDGAGRLVVPE